MIINKKTEIILISITIAFLVALILYVLLSRDEQKLLDEVAPPPIEEVPVEDIESKINLIQQTVNIVTLNDLINKLNTEFIFQERNDRQVLAPEEFYALKRGNQLDFAIFTAFVLKNQNLGEVAVLRYKYIDQDTERIGSGVIFRGSDLPPKYIRFGQGGTEVITYGWSFEELFRLEEERKGVVISGYKIFLLWPLPNAEILWPEEWISR